MKSHSPGWQVADPTRRLPFLKRRWGPSPHFGGQQWPAWQHLVPCLLLTHVVNQSPCVPISVLSELRVEAIWAAAGSEGWEVCPDPADPVSFLACFLSWVTLPTNQPIMHWAGVLLTNHGAPSPAGPQYESPRPGSYF